MSDSIIINTTTENISLSVNGHTDVYSLSVINVDGASRWGLIVGTLSAQTDLYTALSALREFSYSNFIILSSSLDVTNTFIAANSGYWTTAYQETTGLNTTFSKLSTQAYILSGTNILPVLGHNTASGGYSVIGGGNSNTASGCYSTVAGGCQNHITQLSGNGGYGSTVSGGYNNCICHVNWASIIGGGGNNLITDLGNSVIAGGWQNHINANSTCSNAYGTIGGGIYNSSCASNTTIGGGCGNIVNANNSGILGGYNNIVDVSAHDSFIIGSNITAISANYTYVNNLSSQGIIIDASGDSNQWNEAYTNLVSNSAAYLSATDLSFLSVSGNWNSVYTNANELSSNWEEAYAWTVSNSANATFSTVSAISLSGTFYGDGSNLIGASLPGQADINTLVRGTSAEWNAAYSNIVSNSAAYLSSVDLSFLSVSSNWNSSYTTVNSNSSTTWNYQGTDLKNLSSDWIGGNAAYTNLVSNSAAYLSATDLSFLSVSGNWDSAYTTVNSNSSTTWNYQGTDLKDLSSGWVGGQDAYTNLVLNSAAYLSAVDLSFLSVSANWNEAYSNLILLSSTYSSVTAVNGTTFEIDATNNNGVVTLKLPNSIVTPGDLNVTGSFFVNGSAANINSLNISLSDSLIYLAEGNVSNVVDIGFVGNFTPAPSSYQHTGLVRVARDNKWTLFSGITAEPTTVVDFSSGYNIDTLRANIEGTLFGNVTGNITGNAGSVTNGVYTNGSYSDPSWITSLADTKITGSSRDNWDSVYTNVNQNSSTTWNYQGTDLKNLSSDWVGGNSAYTWVNSNSDVATFITSVSAPSLSGTHYGDGSKLSGILSPAGLYLPLSGGALTGALTTTSTISASNSITAYNLATQNQVQYLSSGTVKAYQYYNSFTNSLDTVFN